MLHGGPMTALATVGRPHLHAPPPMPTACSRGLRPRRQCASWTTQQLCCGSGRRSSRARPGWPAWIPVRAKVCANVWGLAGLFCTGTEGGRRGWRGAGRRRCSPTGPKPQPPAASIPRRCRAHMHSHHGRRARGVGCRRVGRLHAQRVPHHRHHHPGRTAGERPTRACTRAAPCRITSGGNPLQQRRGLQKGSRRALGHFLAVRRSC